MSWNEAPLCICINLTERSDRYEYSTDLAKKLGIPLEFHRPVRDPAGGNVGCFRSHLACIRKAYEAGHEFVVIFEDDFKPTSAYNETTVANCFKFLKENQDWNLFYFGALPRNTGSYKTAWPKIWKGGCICCHAYAVSRRFMERIYTMDYPYMPWDNFLVYVDGSYFHSPPLFRQRTITGSDLRPSSVLESSARTEWYFNLCDRHVTNFKGNMVASILLVLVVAALLWWLVSPKVVAVVMTVLWILFYLLFCYFFPVTLVLNP